MPTPHCKAMLNEWLNIPNRFIGAQNGHILIRRTAQLPFHCASVCDSFVDNPLHHIERGDTHR
jgi:hypothetical protein